MYTTPPQKSDLGVRTASAVVMLAVAGTALWIGGWVWNVFVCALAVGMLWEWRGLVRGFVGGTLQRTTWGIAGVVYIGLAAAMLIFLRSRGPGEVLLFVGAVIATDIGAYFSGRAIGGPKIAPKISPSKTWAGLFGGMVAASLTLIAINLADNGAHAEDVPLSWRLVFGIASGSLIAIIAQTGDFFESWMKRRAGVKDSGSLIPGHGGLFDRVDGLLAVMFLLGLVFILARMTGNS